MSEKASAELRWTRALSRSMLAIAHAPGPAEIARAVEALLLDELGDRARCVFYDAPTGVAWSPDGADPDPDAASVARSRQALVAGDRIAKPVVGVDVQAVLIVARSTEAFGPADLQRLDEAARHLAPLLDYHALRAELDVGPADPGLFRREAVEAHRARRDRGELLDLRSGWVRSTWRAVVGVAGAALVAVSAVPVGDWSAGPALVRLVGRREVAATVLGSVAEVLVRPGERVDAGAPLVRLDDSGRAAALTRIELAFDDHLRDLLRDPSDRGASEAVTALRAERAEALENREGATLRAPEPGVVADVRATVGEAVQAGDVLVTLDGEGGGAELVALMPGDERPRLHPGMDLRFRVDGTGFAPTWVSVDRIDEDVVPVAEARRMLGPVADGLAGEGPVTLVRAPLPESAGGLRYHDGMRGVVEVRIRTTPLVLALVPGFVP